MITVSTVTCEVKMSDTRFATMSRRTHSIASLKNVRNVVFDEPRKTRQSANTTYANIPRLYHVYQLLV